MRSEMRAYLNTPIDRRGTNCEKWDLLERYFGRGDLLAMWVADMDFRTVPQVREALVRRAEHAIYGYTDNAEAEHEAEAGWLLRRWYRRLPAVAEALRLRRRPGVPAAGGAPSRSIVACAAATGRVRRAVVATRGF